MVPIKLQNLPKHITQRIAFKAAQWRKVGIDEALPNISNPAWKMVNYLALCQSWRYHCIPLYCQDMSISLDRTFGSIEDTHYWLSTINDVMRLSGQQYTRNAHLHVPLSQVLNGVLPRLLSEPPYRDSVFPNVSVIWFKLYAGGEIKDTVGGDNRRNESIDVLVSQIQRMFPSARICSISSSVALAADEKWALKYCDVLFSKLMANSTGLKYYAASEHFVNTPVPLLAGLTRISYFECENASQFMQLICNHRETLVVVSLELIKPTTIMQMFATDNQWLTFPRLERLEVDCQEHELESRVHAPGAPLFPSLKRLTFRHPYPFTNDAMFRGNYGKLEHLSLSLDTEDISSLLYAGVLKEGAFSALKFVDLDVNLSQQPLGDLAYGEQLCQMLWHLAPAQEHLSVNLLGFVYKEAFVQAVQHKEGMGLLSFLSIGSLELDIWETIRILSHVPTLSQLEINPKTMDINKPWYLQNMTDAKYVDDLVGWFHPLAPRLRHILFDLGLYSDMEGAAHFAALLAILCPKVDCVRWGMHSAAFEKCCRALADSAAYAKYAGRLGLVDWSKGNS